MAGRRKRTDDLTTVDPKECRAAAKAIWNAFVWSDLREGNDGWMKIATRLEALAEAGEKVGKAQSSG